MGVRPEALVTVHQVHSARALPVTGPLSIRPEADALVTATPGVLLAVSDRRLPAGPVLTTPWRR
jgi:copper oxidase (laccase) domain-containing protein